MLCFSRSGVKFPFPAEECRRRFHKTVAHVAPDRAMSAVRNDPKVRARDCGVHLQFSRNLEILFKQTRLDFLLKRA
jgi:hypothetical protein